MLEERLETLNKLMKENKYTPSLMTRLKEQIIVEYEREDNRIIVELEDERMTLRSFDGWKVEYNKQKIKYFGQVPKEMKKSLENYFL